MKLSLEQTKYCHILILKVIEYYEMNLPDLMETNKLYKLKYYANENRGLREMRFIILINENNNLFIDVYLKTDSYSSHKRIDYGGNIIELENYIYQFGWPVFENKNETEIEHFRIREHNNRVYEKLKLKGFED